MKKLYLVLFLAFILFSCDDGIMEEDNSKTEQGYLTIHG